MGIVGLPNVGKSTLFNVLTRMGIPAENFPFCTIEPNAVRHGTSWRRFDNMKVIVFDAMQRARPSYDVRVVRAWRCWPYVGRTSRTCQGLKLALQLLAVYISLKSIRIHIVYMR